MSKKRKKVNNNICTICAWRKTHGTGKLCSICKRLLIRVAKKRREEHIGSLIQ